jgi:hypothetical protein
LIFGPWRPEHAAAPTSRTAASRPRRARTPRQASDPWSMRRHRPCRTAIQVLSTCATHPCIHARRAPPNRDVAVRAPRRPCAAIGHRASPPPQRAHAMDGCDPLLKARTPTKGLDSPRALCPGHRAAIAAASDADAELLPPAAVPPMRVALACLRTPSSYSTRLLLRPSRQLAGIRAPTATAGQALPSPCPRLLSEPMGPRSSSSRSH